MPRKKKMGKEKVFNLSIWLIVGLRLSAYVFLFLNLWVFYSPRLLKVSRVTVIREVTGGSNFYVISSPSSL